jgi:undecaprenyl diphosphate synthase
MDSSKLPNHIAIIMDGNGRWAKKRFQPRIFGHREGMKRVKEIVTYCRKSGIKVLSLFAFSSENWARPEQEVKFLMSLLEEYVKKEVKELKKNNVRLKFIGDLTQVPKKYFELIKQSEKELEDCNGLILNIALSYGGRQDILNAVKKIAEDTVKRQISIEDITEEKFSKYLYTSHVPDPDFLIRTSGEMRISNFFLWQLAYTEIYVTDTLWPDFSAKHLEEAINDFSKRERRFGKITEQLNEN